MKKFAFRLEPVLKLRSYKERMAQMELAKAQADLLESRALVEQSKARQISARRDWDGGLEKGMWETEFRMHADYIRGLELEIKRAIENEARFRKAVEQSREALMKATIGRKTMDLLRDERLDQHMLETGRLEQKELDELANLHRSSRERLEP